MLQLIGNRLYQVPRPQITAGAILIRVEMALHWQPRVNRSSPLGRLWRRYPNAARKWADYVWHEGLRSTIIKTRAQLDTLQINDVGKVASLYGHVEAVGDGVGGFAVGDSIAGYGFERPVFADYLLLPAAWCCPVQCDPRVGAALLPGLCAIRSARPIMDVLRNGDSAAQVDPEWQNISLYSDQPVYVPFSEMQIAAYFGAAQQFEPALKAVPNVAATRAGQVIKGSPLFVISSLR